MKSTPILIWQLIFISSLGIENAVAAKSWQTLSGNPTTIAGHRGEKVLMPEHTVGSYEVACIQGADFVEPDLVLTKDSQLICYHDLTLKGGTNIEFIPQLQNLKKMSFTGKMGCTNVTITDDWFVTDLTLSEIKMLRVEQKDIGIRPQYFNTLFQIPTFEEYLDVIHKMSHKMNRSIGIIPELKQPDFINRNRPNNYIVENKVLEILRKYGYPLKSSEKERCQTPDGKSIPCGKVFLMSFDRRSLEYLKKNTDIELMMLVDDCPEHLTRNGLRDISRFAKYYSVWKEYLFSGVEEGLKFQKIEYDLKAVNELQGGFIKKETVVTDVHLRNMQMGIFTVFDSREPSTLGCSVACRPENKTAELFHYFDLGVDIMFAENIREATELRLQYSYSLAMSDGTRIRVHFSFLIIGKSILVFLLN